MNDLSVMQLARELKASGWDKPRKTLILAARFYKGLETAESMHLSGRLASSEVNFILYWR
jgi:hypothetical protein